MVINLPHVTPPRLRRAISDHLERDGWTELLNAEGLARLVDEFYDVIAEVCAAFPTGAVGREGTLVFCRRPPVQAVA